jgi:hypothetical protein
MGETGNGGTGKTVVEGDEACTGEVTKDCVRGTGTTAAGSPDFKGLNSS